MAEAGEGRAARSPIQPLSGSRRTAAIGSGGANIAESIRPPRLVRAPQALRHLPLSTSKSWTSAARRLPAAPLSQGSATAPPAAGHAAALHLSGLLPKSPRQHFGRAATQVGAHFATPAAAARANDRSLRVRLANFFYVSADCINNSQKYIYQRKKEFYFLSYSHFEIFLFVKMCLLFVIYLTYFH